MYVSSLTTSQFSALIRAEINAAIQEAKTNLEMLLPNEPSKFYTIKGVAKMLEITPATIHNYVKQGILIKHKISGRTLFKKSEVDRLTD
jgi:predicted DNA-binding transcriptional regulator AlpA